MPTWIEALKTYNSRQPAWCIPRKGTDEYNKVRKIMSGEKTKIPKKLKVVDSLKQKVGMTDVPQDVMNLMGNYLGTKDKAQFNQVNKNVKLDYSKEEKIKKINISVFEERRKIMIMLLEKFYFWQWKKKNYEIQKIKRKRVVFLKKLIINIRDKTFKKEPFTNHAPFFDFETYVERSGEGHRNNFFDAGKFRLSRPLPNVEKNDVNYINRTRVINLLSDKFNTIEPFLDIQPLTDEDIKNIKKGENIGVDDDDDKQIRKNKADKKNIQNAYGKEKLIRLDTIFKLAHAKQKMIDDFELEDTILNLNKLLKKYFRLTIKKNWKLESMINRLDTVTFKMRKDNGDSIDLFTYDEKRHNKPQYFEEFVKKNTYTTLEPFPKIPKKIQQEINKYI